MKFLFENDAFSFEALRLRLDRHGPHPLRRWAQLKPQPVAAPHGL
ncbi:hypothetical protein [Streptomyces hygroscopicus]|nr:hypothetical protein [Streptomyces hygroscopicus]